MYNVIKKSGNLHPGLHGSLVRHQDINPKENQRSVVQFKAHKVSIKGGELNYKSVAKEISKPPFLR